MLCVKLYNGLITIWISSRLENHCWCLTGSGAATPWRHDSDSLHALNFCLSWYAIIHGYPQTEMCHICKLHVRQFYWRERYSQIVRRSLVRVGNGHRLVQLKGAGWPWLFVDQINLLEIKSSVLNIEIRKYLLKANIFRCFLC